MPRTGPSEWRTRCLRRISSLHFVNRETVIATVSRWIQSSTEAWRVCFQVITLLALIHLATQTWYALPILFDNGAAASITSWQTVRRLYLFLTGGVALAAIVSLHVQIQGLVGLDGIVPFPQHAGDRIQRFPPEEALLSWDHISKHRMRWFPRCMNILESRWWAWGVNVDRSKPFSWWKNHSCGFTDAKVTQLCWIGEVMSLLFMALSLIDGLSLRFLYQNGNVTVGIGIELLLGIVRVLALLVVTLCYRILKGVSNVFTALQWDILLIEANLLAVPLALPLLPNCWLPALLLPQQICAFKCLFGSGVVKRRSRCPRWATSTAMDLHYETQPLPHMLSWYAHALPHWWHAQECWIAFLVQLPLTMLQWGTWHCRLAGFLAYGSLMFAISATGNYGFFNIQVQSLAVSILDDSLIPFSLPTPVDIVPSSVAVVLLPFIMIFGMWIAAACGLSMLQLPRMEGIVNVTSGSRMEKIFYAAQHAHEALHPLGIGHSYGPFAGMTTFRWELIFEFSNDNEHWIPIEFPYKPGCIDTKPQWMPLGHFARLDWRLWFVPLGFGRGRWELPDWVESFIKGLLRGSEHVAGLTMNKEAILSMKPTRVRVSVWDYHFASCDPTVHQCAQVTITRAERDAACLNSKQSSSKWQPASQVSSVTSFSSRYDQQKDTPTEWGRWWYRRLVGHYGIYFLRDGELQFSRASSMCTRY